MSKSKRPKSRSSRTSDRSPHLHLVIDPTLRAKLEAHARKLEGVSKNDDVRLNLSAAARDAMRKGLGLPGVEAL